MCIRTVVNTRSHLESTHHSGATPAVGYWLLAVFAFIGVMVLVGGLTRLTLSGLSMVDWRPATGWLPPLSDEEWQAAFAAYKDKANFQFERVFGGQLTLDGFKEIFFWEYFHRLLGRLLGLFFAVPWLYFSLRKRMSRRYIGLTFIALCLGGLQGFVGWWMVKSGLTQMPHVSHYRLAVHLGLALFCAMYVLWLALSILRPREKNAYPLRRIFIFFLCLVTVQIVFGAFMAGTRAGHIYQTFPLMNGQFLPTWDADMTPVALNLTENLSVLQFIHRTLGWIVLFAGLGLGFRGYLRSKDSGQRRAALSMGSISVLQFGLGVLAVVLPGIPISIGSMHQIGAFFLLAATVTAIHSQGGPERARQP